MSGRHAAVVARPIEFARLSEMFAESDAAGRARARALTTAHRRRSIAWNVIDDRAIRHGAVVVPVVRYPGLWCNAVAPWHGYTCKRPEGHTGRHAHLDMFDLLGRRRTASVLAVWAGGPRRGRRAFGGAR